MAGASQDEAEGIGRIARELQGVLSLGSIDELDLAKITGRGVEVQGDVESPLCIDGGVRGQRPIQRSGPRRIAAQALACEIHPSGISRPKGIFDQEGVRNGSLLAVKAG